MVFKVLAGLHDIRGNREPERCGFGESEFGIRCLLGHFLVVAIENNLEIASGKNTVVEHRHGSIARRIHGDVCRKSERLDLQVVVGSVVDSDIIHVHVVADIVVCAESYLEILRAYSLLEGKIIAVPAIAVDEENRFLGESLVFAVDISLNGHGLLLGGVSVFKIRVIVMIEPERENRIAKTGDIDFRGYHARFNIDEVGISHEHAAVFILSFGFRAAVLVVGIMAECEITAIETIVVG